MKTMKKWVMCAAAGVAAGLAAADDRPPYSVMQNYTLQRINVPVVAGAAKWTNTYQTLAVVSVEYIGAQAANTYHTSTYSVVSGAPSTPSPSWTVITNAVTNIVLQGAGNTATAYALATNVQNSFYADLWTFAGVGTNAGQVLIKGYCPTNR